jgi:haloalkane dehalogenase
MSNTDWIDRNEYPFASHYFQTQAGKLHYVDEGEGQPIVMIHGNPTWSFLYRKLIKRLSQNGQARFPHPGPDGTTSHSTKPASGQVAGYLPEGEGIGFRCIAPDHIGFGLSDKPVDWSYLPEEHAKNLAALIEHLGLKNVTLVVQDWGGPIGIDYALKHPENVSRLIVMNTWAWPVNRDPHYVMFSAFMGGPIGRLLIRKRNFFAKTFMRAAFGDKRKLTEAAHRHYLRALPTEEDRKGCHVFPKQIVASTPWLARLWNQISVLRDKPALFVWGMKDVAFREKELMRWQSAFPNSQTVRLATVGHFVQEEAPEELAHAVAAFLDKSQ